jgi:hypothetical protein
MGCRAAWLQLQLLDKPTVHLPVGRQLLVAVVAPHVRVLVGLDTGVSLEALVETLQVAADVKQGDVAVGGVAVLQRRPQLADHVLAVDVLQVHEPLASEGERALVGVDVMCNGVVVEVAICRARMASGQACTVSWSGCRGLLASICHATAHA